MAKQEGYVYVKTFKNELPCGIGRAFAPIEPGRVIKQTYRVKVRIPGGSEGM